MPQQKQAGQHQPQHLAWTVEENKVEGGGELFRDKQKPAAISPAVLPGKDVEHAAGGNDEGTAEVVPPSPVGEDDADSGSGALGISVFIFLKAVTALSGLYMCTNPWFLLYDAEKGEICPYTVICATSPVELALLTASRLSAGLLYASLSISIVSKCYATRSFLHHSWLGAVLDFEPSHDIHTYFGYLTLVAGFEHGILHCIRFTVAGQAWIIHGTDTGRSGVVACLFLLPIVLPMKFDLFKRRMPFQFRKNLHMLFLGLLVALCFHSVHFRYVGSGLLLWYSLDRFYFTTKQTFLINDPVFEAVGRGTMVGLDLPEGYTFKAGSYIYVNSPTISRSEWHPFSIIQVQGRTPKAAFYAEAVGDWTRELFRLGLGQPRLPLWITAAQPSLMERSIYYENVVLVCTGAGITPAVSIIERFAKRKNIHLMWMTRDSGMVALFERELRKVNSTVHLTGNQTDQTKDALRHLLLPPPPLPSARGQADDLDASSRSILATNSSFRSRLPSRSRADTGGAADEESGGRAPHERKGSHDSRTHAVFMARSTSDGQHTRARPSRWDSFASEDLSSTDAPPPPHPLRLPVDSYYLDSAGNLRPYGPRLHRADSGGGSAGGEGGGGEGRLEGVVVPRPERFTSNMSRASVVTRTSSIRPSVDPITLVFGRPDIGKYLTETFAVISESPPIDDGKAADGGGGGRSGGSGGGDGGGGTRTKSVSQRSGAKDCHGSRAPSAPGSLDRNQKASKAMLMRADSNVAELADPSFRNKRNQQPKNSAQGANSSSNVPTGRPSRARASSPLPWLVLYCGANPKVEEAIATTCDDLRVQWKKEYFGAW